MVVTNGRAKTEKDQTYQLGDKVLQINEWKTKFNQDAYISSYMIRAVRNNGTIRSRKR